MEKKPGKRGQRPLSGTLSAALLPKVAAILITVDGKARLGKAY